MRFRPALIALAALAVAGTVSLIPAASASAAPAVPAKPAVPAVRVIPAKPAAPAESAASACPAGHVCFYSGPNYTGEMKVSKNPKNHKCGAVPLKPARSIRNRDDQTWGFYADRKCTDHARTLAPGAGITYTEGFSWA